MVVVDLAAVPHLVMLVVRPRFGLERRLYMAHPGAELAQGSVHRQRLLLFTQPRPGAGIQVPAGTLLPGEAPEDGVLREAWEETGLESLALGTYLGRKDWVRDIPALGRPEMHERHFFHVLCTTEPPEAWQHVECDPSDGSSPIPFDFFWASLPHGVPRLVANHDESKELK